jgi:hypothetical protein
MMGRFILFRKKDESHHQAFQLAEGFDASVVEIYKDA